MAVVVRETERKFHVPPGFQLPDLVSVGVVTAVSGPERSVLLAVYYDTADLRLVRDGLTLRRREGGADAGWHLKLPVHGSQSRDEVRLPLSAGEEGRVPEELGDLVSAFTRGLPLQAVATLRTEREVCVLHGRAGPLAELALDSVTVVRAPGATGGDPKAVEGFRELELEELGDGSAGVPAPDLDAVVQRLLASGAQARPLVPKLTRALGTAASGTPDVPVPPARIHRSAPAADLVQAHIASQVRALRRADVGVRRGDADAVHRARVAARRLRSGLRVLRPLLDRTWADDLRGELAWLAGELGHARDGEVLSARLEAAGRTLPAEVDASTTRTFLSRHLGTDVVAARAHAQATLRSSRYLQLVDRLVDGARTPPTTPAAQESCTTVLPPLVASAWRRLAREADRVDLEGADEPWHEVRKRAKAVRYAAEAVAPAMGKPAKRLARRAERVTELLGEHQDAIIAADALTRLVTRPRTGARAAFGLGVLYGIQRDDVRTSRQQFLDTWPAMSRRAHRRWLTKT